MVEEKLHVSAETPLPQAKVGRKLKQEIGMTFLEILRGLVLYFSCFQQKEKAME